MKKSEIVVGGRYIAKVEGLWRTATKTKPGSMTEYIKKHKLIPLKMIKEAEAMPLNKRPVRGEQACEACSEDCF